MSYENKEYILQFFEGVHEEGNRDELIEVYQKAKAWDRVYEAFEKAKNEHEFSNGVCTIMNEYESGDSDEL